MSKKKEPVKSDEIAAEVGIDFLGVKPDDLDLFACRVEARRLQRMINIMIAADFCTRQKAEQAYEIAGWD